jgi:hypothetical protein
MKRYFIKLMPDNGKIQEGDLAMKEDGAIVYVNEAAAKHLTDKWKRVKMQVCDTEFSVGENIWYYSRDNSTLFNGVLAKIEGENIYLEEDRDFENPDVSDAFYMCYRKGTAFKIIGHVSEASSWVKEGIYFDESDLQWIIYHSYEPDEFFPISNDWVKCMKKVGNSKWCIDNFPREIAIKCPNCKIFH